ncbi:MAG: HAD family hydrolase [Planctomycetota bacterium]|jgi:HAD superfamily hydrolase (TIGR01509 family)
MVLEDTGLRHLFEVIVSGEQVKKGKPDPEGFLLTLKRLNSNVSLAQAGNQNHILPGECIVIEDSHWGLEAAKAAEMHTIAVTNSYEAEQLSMAEKVVNGLNELSIGDLQQLCS